MNTFVPFIVCYVLQGNITSFQSVGYIGIRDNTSTRVISKIYPDSPAELGGLKTGDKIVAVVDEEGKKEISGPVGSYVTLSVKRAGEINLFILKRVPEQWGRHK